jgi:hypothetical protein
MPSYPHLNGQILLSRMQPIRMSGPAHRLRPKQKTTSSRLKATAFALVAVFTMALTASSAYASCGEVGGMKGSAIKMPMLAGAGSHLADMEDATQGRGANDSIVGLWHVVYTAGDSIFGVSLKQWHSDGTEFENIAHSPTIGNICFGVWKQVGFHTVRLHHTGWLFSDQGVLTGTFTIDETDTVGEDGMSYKGNFVFKTFDTNGTFTGTEVSGSIAATRITVS